MQANSIQDACADALLKKSVSPATSGPEAIHSTATSSTPMNIELTADPGYFEQFFQGIPRNAFQRLKVVK
jgi:hypothetical protein